MEQLTNVEIKDVQLDLLKKFKSLCENNNFKYYLFFGTLLGSIRHKGFIPWDDDIDIIMPREDYEKFIDFCINNQKEIYPYGIVHYKNKKKYAITIGKFENKEYMLYGSNGMRCEVGINIDIYPLDGVGNTKKDIQNAIKKYNKWKSYKKYFENHGFNKSNNVWLTKFRYCFFLIYELIFDCWVSSLDKQCRRKKIDNYEICGIPIWQPDEGSYFEKKLLGHAFAEFEGDFYPIPEGYDTILKQIYGNYMELPPIEKRRTYHIDVAYRL